VNGHVGNARLRDLALERKIQFDSGNYTEKRSLATEVVQIIRSLEPPGRFLKRAKEAGGGGKQPAVKEDDNNIEDEDNWDAPSKGLEGTWEELSDEKAIHKACQVMRDIDRPDRKEREKRRKDKKQKVEGGGGANKTEGEENPAKEEGGDAAMDTEGDVKEESSMNALAEATEKAAVEEAVAAAEAALDKALDAVPDKAKGGGLTMDIAETAMV
jgi:hypothetical protein